MAGPTYAGIERANSASYRLWVLLVGLALATLAALLLGNGNPVVAMAPTAIVVCIALLLKLPLKYPVTALFASALLFAGPSEETAEGHWQAPWKIVGALLFDQWKQTFAVSSFVFMGLDLILVLLFGIYLYRKIAGSEIDRLHRTTTPRPLVYAAWASLAGIAIAFAWGMVTGGSFRFALWQMQRNIYLPIVFLLFVATVPERDCYRTFGIVLVLAAVARAILAIYVRSLIPATATYATTHADSMLYAIATLIVVLGVVEARSRQSLVVAFFVLPILTWGMIANQRRLVAAELGVAVAFLFWVMRRSWLKIRLVRGLIYALPVLVTYVTAGWSSESGVFKPVTTIRSIVDSKADTSTQWRDLENFNLITTLKHNPIFGTGWGHPFEFAVALPDVTSSYELEPYVPHNSILGLWAYTGYFGFALQWFMLMATVYFSIRAYRVARAPWDRVACLTCYASVVVYMVHLYGDMALGTRVAVFTIPAAMLISGKLAVSLGMWPGQSHQQPGAARVPGSTS